MNGIDPIFSFKGTEETDLLNQDVIGDVAELFEAVTSIFDKIKGVVSSIFDFAFGAYQETKDVDFSTLRPRDIKVVPTSVENAMGGVAASKVCSEKEMEAGTELDSWLQEVGGKLLSHASRKELDYQFILKKDESENAFVVPGGKMILTTGLVAKLKEQGGEKELASVLSYLIARSEGSEEVKRAQTGTLMHIVGKVSSFVSSYLFPEDVEDKQSLKKNRAVNELVEQGVELGSQVLLRRQSADAEEKSRLRAVQLLIGADYEADKKSMDTILDRLLDLEEDEEAYQDDIHEQLGAMMPNILKIFA
jgi:hypothetical protein